MSRRSLLDPTSADRRAAATRARRAEVIVFLRNYKSERGCIDCGERDWRCLDIDHMTGKTRKIADCYSIRLLLKEIQQHKCVVRCANCHRKRTYEEQLGAPARARRAA